MGLTWRTRVLIAAIILLFHPDFGQGAGRFDGLGLYLTKNGYGGAQLVQLGNFFHLPIQTSGKPANLVVDTGSPSTLIFRSSLKGLNLNESTTSELVNGAFGQARDCYGLTTIRALTTGDGWLSDAPVMGAWR